MVSAAAFVQVSSDASPPVTWEAIRLLLEPLARDWTARVVVAILLGFVCWKLARAAQGWLDRAATRLRVDSNTRFLSGHLLYWLVLALGIVLILGLLGIDQSFLLATVGAGGLALGIAAQDVIKSFLAGLYLLFERPFLLGDEIEVKDKVGRVEHVGFRATTIRTADNVRILVPNVIVFNEVVSNRSERTEPAKEPPEH